MELPSVKQLNKELIVHELSLIVTRIREQAVLGNSRVNMTVRYPANMEELLRKGYDVDRINNHDPHYYSIGW